MLRWRCRCFKCPFYYINVSEFNHLSCGSFDLSYVVLLSGHVLKEMFNQRVPQLAIHLSRSYSVYLHSRKIQSELDSESKFCLFKRVAAPDCSEEEMFRPTKGQQCKS
jgi:hypothetical protein